MIVYVVSEHSSMDYVVSSCVTHVVATKEQAQEIVREFNCNEDPEVWADYEAFEVLT